VPASSPAITAVCRKRTRIIDLHVRIGIAFQRHFPGLLYFAISRAIRRAGFAQQSGRDPSTGANLHGCASAKALAPSSQRHGYGTNSTVHFGNLEKELY